MSDREQDIPERLEALLGDHAVWAEPPGDLETRMLAEITTDADGHGDVAASGSRWWPAMAVAAAVVALFLAFGPTVRETEPDGVPLAMHGTLLAPDAVAAGRVGPSQAGWWIRLQIDDLEPAPDGTFYEGWVSDGEHVVSVGSFHMHDGTSVVLWSGVPVSEFQEMFVTRQDVGASAEPSSVVVLKGGLETEP